MPVGLADERNDESGQDDIEEEIEPFWILQTITEEMLDQARELQLAIKDREFAENVMAIAKSCDVVTHKVCFLIKLGVKLLCT